VTTANSETALKAGSSSLQRLTYSIPTQLIQIYSMIDNNLLNSQLHALQNTMAKLPVSLWRLSKNIYLQESTSDFETAYMRPTTSYICDRGKAAKNLRFEKNILGFEVFQVF